MKDKIKLRATHSEGAIVTRRTLIDAPTTLQSETIKALVRDNKALTDALQRIEAGDDSPRDIARQVLDRPSWMHLYE